MLNLVNFENMLGSVSNSGHSSEGSKRRKHRRSKSGINDHVDEDLLRPKESWLRPDDKERMVYNPGKSLKSSSKDVPFYLRNTALNSFAFFRPGLFGRLLSRENRLGGARVFVQPRPRHILPQNPFHQHHRLGKLRCHIDFQRPLGC